MDQSSSFHRTASGYEPFRRAGSFMSNSRSSRTSETSVGTFSTGSDMHLLSPSTDCQDYDGIAFGADSDNDEVMMESFNGVSLRMQMLSMLGKLRALVAEFRSSAAEN
jgi:hypothetical protein